MIGPVKQEDEWDSPHIVRYHNIVSEKDMEKVKELAKPRVSLSIFNSRTAAEFIRGRTPLVLSNARGGAKYQYSVILLPVKSPYIKIFMKNVYDYFPRQPDPTESSRRSLSKDSEEMTLKKKLAG